MPRAELKMLCDYEPCGCPVENHDSIEVEGARYCSEGCARGEGCQHTSCNCVTHEERSVG